MNIKAVSSAITKKASQQKHTRTWENVSLNHVISDIASANNLSLFMKAENDTTFERIDQTQQSDLDFLRTLCADEGLSVKIQAERLVVYDTETFENASPITSLALDDERLISCRFSSKSAKVSKKAKVHYHDSYKDEDYYAEYEDDDIEGSERELEIYERVESQAHAEKLAEKRLIDANRKEITGSLTLMGDTRFAAGLTISLNDFGMFSGNHFISKATHTINNSGYSVSLELGQPKSEKGKAKKRKGSRKKEGSASIIYYEGDKHY